MTKGDKMGINVQQAQNKIVSKQMDQQIKLPGNRKQRRQAMKEFKIPKSAVYTYSKQESEAFTKETIKNIIE